MSILLQVGVGALLEVLLEECLELLAVALQHHQLLKVVGSQGGPLGAEDVAGGAEQPLSGSGTGQGGVVFDKQLHPGVAVAGRKLLLPDDVVPGPGPVDDLQLLMASSSVDLLAGVVEVEGP